MKDIEQLKRVFEGALFAASEPLDAAKLSNLFDEDKVPDRKEIREALQALQKDYEGHGIELKDLASGWQFQVCQDLAPWIKKMWQERAPRYSRALMETLALIAYKQPITRAEIEQVRGVVVSSQIVRTLEEHGWIRIVGHKDVPGKPALWATSKQFLDHFGMKSLSELPPLQELKDLDSLGDQLQQQLSLASDDAKEDEAVPDEEQQDSQEEPQEGSEHQHDVPEEGAENEGMPEHPDDKEEDAGAEESPEKAEALAVEETS